MSSLILEFPLPSDSVVIDGNKMSADLGNGVRLTTSTPEGLGPVRAAKLQLVLDIDGVIPNASSVQN